MEDLGGGGSSSCRAEKRDGGDAALFQAPGTDPLLVSMRKAMTTLLASRGLYISPITFARFEVDAGSTNRSNVRLDGSAVVGTERQAAAVRIAVS